MIWVAVESTGNKKIPAAPVRPTALSREPTHHYNDYHDDNQIESSLIKFKETL